MTILEEIEEYTRYFDPRRFTQLNDEWRRLVGYDNYYRWLWAAVMVLHPLNVVEIGRERGVSALIMLDGLSDLGTLVSIDIVEESLFLENFYDPRLTLVTSDSLKASDYVNDIDFLFIDGNHTGEHVAKEWALYRPKLRENAVVAFDDIHFNDGMTEFWNSLEGDKHDISRWHEPGFGVLFI